MDNAKGFFDGEDAAEDNSGSPNMAGANVPSKYTYKQEKPPLLAQVGRGMTDVWEGGKQLYLENFGDEGELEAYEKDVNEERDLYARGQGDDFDVGRMVGNIAPFLATAPLAAGAGLGWGGAALIGAGEGALQGGTSFVNQGESRVGNLLTGLLGGTAGGVLFKGAANAIAPAYRGAKGLLSAGTDAVGDVFETGAVQAGAKGAQLVRDQVRAGLKPDPALLERQARLESHGFTGDAAPTTKQISRDPATWTKESELAKREGAEGGRLTERMQAQDARFKEIFVELRQKSGRTGEEVIDAGESVSGAVNQRWAATQEAVGKLYKKAEQEFGDIGGIDVGGILRMADDIGDDVSLAPITDSIKRTLKKMGLTDKDGNLTGETLTVSQAEGLRKFIGGLGGGGGATQAQIRMVKRQIIEALDDSVFTRIGDDAFSEARGAASARFDEFSNSIADKIIKGKLRGDDAVKEIVHSASSADLGELRQILLKSEGGKEALDSLKAEVIDALEMTARANKPDHSPFSGAAFSRGLDKFGKKKLAALFGDDMHELYALRESGLDMTFAPPFSNVNNSNTSSALINGIKGGTFDVPIVGKAIKGAGDQRATNKALQGSSVSGKMKRNESQRLADLWTNSPYTRGAQGLLHPSIVGSQQANEWWNQ